MKKILLLLSVLLAGVSGAWATLSSSTIAKSGNVTDSWYIVSSLPTDNWTALSNVPAGIAALGGTPFYRTQNITISDEGALSVTFLYTSGNHRLDILGVDLLNSSDEVVRSDYHVGYTGGERSHNVYMIDHIASGNYKIRFIINNASTTNSAGNITIKHINIKTANSFAEITHWYSIRMHSNQTHYMYYKSDAATGIGFDGSLPQNAYYLWGFVKDTDGIKIYNKAAGGSVAIDNATPCKLSADGTSIAFTFDTGNAGNNGAAAGAYFSLYKNPTSGSKSYLNYQGDNINRWGGNDEGSTWMIDEVTFAAPFVAASEGKVYTIKAHFKSTEEYFTNNGTNLDFNTSATNGVNDYWILRSSGNGTYTWKFESGRGDGMFLSNNSDTEGLTSTGVYLQINTYGTYSELRGSNSGDAKTTGIVNLGTWSSASGNKGFGEYGVNCWSGSGHWTDEKWTTSYAIEEVQDVDIYTVISNINAGGVTYSEYTGKKDQTNGGFYILASEPSAGDFSAISVTDFTPGAITVNTTTKTITVNYSSSYSYTFTDVNGQEYTGTITGEFGVTPTLTGCYGYTLSNEVWDEGTNTYTADITFPFAVSSNSVANWIYINIFDAKKNYKISDGHWFYWHANGTNVIVHNCDEPTNESGKIDEYKWAIVPSITNGAITFTIKNAVANKCIYHDGSESYSGHTGIKLGDTGVSLTYVKDASAAKYYWYIPSVGKYLSANSVDGDASQRLGALSAVHDGESVGFYTPADFTTLLANLKTARISFNNYLMAWNLGKYTETVEGTMMTTNNQQGTDRNVVKDPPAAYFNATQFKTYTDNYNNAVAGLRYVVPTFFRVKNVDGSKYVKASTINYSNEVQLSFTAGGTDVASIFYLNASNNITAYNGGSCFGAVNHTLRVSYSSYKGQYEFLPGSAVERVLVHATTDPTGWSGENKYWQSNGDMIARVTSTDASDFLIEEVTALPVTITAAKYATLCAPVALEIPSGVKAYYISNVTKTEATLTKLTGTIPADMPVILYADGLSETTTFNFPITTADAFVGTNILSGQTAAQNVAAGVAYTLQTASNENLAVGFYPKAAGIIAGFRAYLLASALPADVKELKFRFDDADGISTIQGSGLMVNDPEIYNIAGQRISKLQKGVNIVNGKKVLIK